MKYEQFCNAILAVMRSCYVGIGAATEVNTDEWLGDPIPPEKRRTGFPDRDSGVKDYITSLVRAERKKGFMTGFAKGAINVFNDLNAPQDKIFNIGDNRIGAEREFLQWEIEDEEKIQ